MIPKSVVVNSEKLILKAGQTTLTTPSLYVIGNQWELCHQIWSCESFALLLGLVWSLWDVYLPVSARGVKDNVSGRSLQISKVKACQIATKDMEYVTNYWYRTGTVLACSNLMVSSARINTLTYLFNQKKTHHLLGNHQLNHDSFLVRDDHLSIFLQFIAGLCYQMHHLQGHHNTNPVTWKKHRKGFGASCVCQRWIFGWVDICGYAPQRESSRQMLNWLEGKDVNSKFITPFGCFNFKHSCWVGCNCPMSHETTSHSLFRQTGQQLTYTNQVSQALVAWRSNQRSSSEPKYPRPLFQWYSEPRCNTTWAFAASCTPPRRKKTMVGQSHTSEIGISLATMAFFKMNVLRYTMGIKTWYSIEGC